MASFELGTPALSGAEGSNLELNVSTYPNGIYFITLVDQSRNRHMERLVVQH